MAAAPWDDGRDSGISFAISSRLRPPQLEVTRFEPRAPRARAAMLAGIVALHVLIVVAIVSLRVAMPAQEPVPLEVVIMQPPPAPLPATPTPQVPMPTMKPPEVRLPTVPTFETITVRLEEKPAPPPVAAAPVAVPVEAPTAPKSVEPPRFGMAYLNNPAPVYPPMSRRTREQGRVMLRVHVSAAGTVDRIEVQESSGFARLDDAALSTVRRWRFQPARSGNQAVAGTALVPINFELN